MTIKVIYHANCNDGFCSAYLFWKNFTEDPANWPRNEMEFIPMNYGVVLDYDKFNKDDIVYLVDFSFKRPVLIELASRVNQLIVLDHHKTAQQELVAGPDIPDNTTLYFDMEVCGAQLAYNFLKYNDPYCKDGIYPNLVRYVADRDLWKWELNWSKEISMFISSFPYDFQAWRQLEYDLLTTMDNCVSQGVAILRYQQRQIQQAVDKAVPVQLYVPGIATFVIPAVNSTVNFSEVAGELAESNEFGVAWFQRNDGKFQYSLRSREGGADVSEIAKAMGGGGHPKAAGFESDVQVLHRIK